jgi:hypothetical protein
MPINRIYKDGVLVETKTIPDLTAEELSAQHDYEISSIDGVIIKALFNHENRVRVLEAKAPITAAQFKTALKALL